MRFRGLKDRLIHLSSQAPTRRAKEELRGKARSYLASCAQNGCTSCEVTFIAAYLLYKNNDLPKALSTVSTLPDVAVPRGSDA